MIKKLNLIAGGEGERVMPDKHTDLREMLEWRVMYLVIRFI
jgi:hypothetical protein